MKKYIKIPELKHGFLYEISARNAGVGVYDRTKNAFIIPRKKFDEEYLFTEYHYDVGEPLGTAFPLFELELAPIFEDSKEFLKWLIKKESKLNE